MNQIHLLNFPELVIISVVVFLPSVWERGEETERTPPPPEPPNEEFLTEENKEENEL